MAVIAIAGASFCGVEAGHGLLQGQLDSVELDLHGRRASKLEFDLAPLTLDLNSLFLDETLLFLKLGVKCARTGHIASSAFVMGETRLATPLRKRDSRVVRVTADELYSFEHPH